MGICCCLLDPQTNSYQTEVLLIEHVSSANLTLGLLHVCPSHVHFSTGQSRS